MALNFPSAPVTGDSWIDPASNIKWICQVGATGDNADPDNVVWVRQGAILPDDAPQDGQVYGRQDGAWVVIP